MHDDRFGCCAIIDVIIIESSELVTTKVLFQEELWRGGVGNLRQHVCLLEA